MSILTQSDVDIFSIFILINLHVKGLMLFVKIVKIYNILKIFVMTIFSLFLLKVTILVLEVMMSTKITNKIQNI